MASDPVAITKSGQVRGFTQENTQIFLGIPYASGPLTTNRFRAPAPARWDNTFEAKEYGASAPQPHRQFTIIPEPVIEGDECLNLNVFTPDLGAGGLPVLFWIHGGGFVAGSSASPWYRGTRFARDGIVVVSIGYRLGVEGFLSLEAAPTNRAALDWIAALEWVRDNIGEFGGDPGKVTIAGQSAGGAACGTLLVAPSARGLFRSAILMSGVGLSAPSAKRAGELAKSVADELGMSPTADDLRKVKPDKIVEVQEAILARRDNGSPSGLRMPFAPSVDGEILPQSVWDAVRKGVGSDTPVMLGSTEEEGVSASRRAADRTDDDRVTRRLGRMGLSGEKIDLFRRVHEGAPPWRLLGQAATDTTFRVPAVRFSEARTDATAGTWLYDFRWKTEVLEMGAVHCLDVPFAFDVLDEKTALAITGDDPPQKLADEVHGSWVKFIKEGDPGWPRYDREERLTKLFDVPSEVVEDPWKSLREIWINDS